MTDERIWITDRLPTEADADQAGKVNVCTSPTLHKELKTCMIWRYVTPGWPWRHTEYWTPPTPEPIPAAPEAEHEAAAPEIGDWITDRPPTEADADKDGDVEYCSLRRPNDKFCHYMNWRTLIQFEPILPWRHTKWWTSPTPAPTPAAPEPKPEPEAERTTRGFAWFLRVDADPGHAVEEYAVATDGTAWWRIIGKDDRLEDKEWIQVRPLPQPGEE